MIAAVDWTPILVAGITGGLAVLGVTIQQRSVHRDNRRDHLRGIEAIKSLGVTVHELSDTTSDTRADVRDIKADIRDDIRPRLSRLEDQS